MGTPLKSTLASRATPVCSPLSSVSVPARICHTSSVCGQVLKVTSCRRRMPPGVRSTSLRGAMGVALQQFELRIIEARAAGGRVAAVAAGEMDQRILVVHLARDPHDIVGTFDTPRRPTSRAAVPGSRRHGRCRCRLLSVQTQDCLAVACRSDRTGRRAAKLRLVDRLGLLPGHGARRRAGKRRVRRMRRASPERTESAPPKATQRESGELVRVRHGAAHYNEDLCLTPTSV